MLFAYESSQVYLGNFIGVRICINPSCATTTTRYLLDYSEITFLHRLYYVDESILVVDCLVMTSLIISKYSSRIKKKAC
jgi:hypothetical protein